MARRSVSPTTTSSSALLGEAFDGTAQPGSKLPIAYTEFGVQSLIPESERARTRTSTRRSARTRSTRRPRPSTTAGARARRLPAERRSPSSSSTSSTRPTSTDGSPAPTTRTRSRSRASRRSARRRRRLATGSSPLFVRFEVVNGQYVAYQLLPGRPGVATPARRGARGRQGRVRRGDRGLGRADGRAPRLHRHRRSPGQRLLPLEDHRALRGPRRARRGAERHAARRLARDAVLVPRDDEGLRVHAGAQAAEDRPRRARRTSSSTRS